MNFNYSSKKIGGYLLAFFVLFGVATIASTTAQAQYQGVYGQNRRDRDRDDRDRRDRDRDRDRDGDRDRNRNRDDRYRRDDRYGRNGGYGNNQYQVAQQQGYSYGLNVGSADAQRGQSFNPQRSHYWKDGSAGYNSSYGNRGQYKQIFRDAFAQGYREGYSRYGGYDRRTNNGRWGNGIRLPW